MVAITSSASYVKVSSYILLNIGGISLNSLSINVSKGKKFTFKTCMCTHWTIQGFSFLAVFYTECDSSLFWVVKRWDHMTEDNLMIKHIQSKSNYLWWPKMVSNLKFNSTWNLPVWIENNYSILLCTSYLNLKNPFTKIFVSW